MTVRKAFGYIRVSGQGQVQGDGFPRQRKAIKEYAASHNIRIVQWFQEEGVSGTKDLDNRPALAAMVEALHGNGVRLVLVERLDRLARDLMVQESILQDLNRKGIQLLSVSEPDLCSEEPTRVLMRRVLGAFFDYEKCMIVSKLKGARERVKARTGKCEGRKPFGHYPGEKATLVRMKELRASGIAYDRIADTLNQEGIKPRTEIRKGKPCVWHAPVVRRILLAQASEARQGSRDTRKR